MKKILCIVLALVMLLGCFASCKPTDDTADKSSQGASSQAGSSGDTYVPYYEVPEGYCDVNMAIREAGASTGWDVSEYFDPDAKGYAIYDGTYMVNAETLRRLTEVPVVGDGDVIWMDYKMLYSSLGHTDLFTGYIPVEKLHDPVFMSMNLPSEAQTYMKDRINGGNMTPPSEKFTQLMTIGAIYKAAGAEIPDDAEITLCLGKTSLLLRTEKEGWFVAKQTVKPSRPETLYPLPWDGGAGIAKITASRIVEHDDHYEIKLTGAMLNGTYKGLQFNSKGKEIDESCLHFWGGNVAVNGGEIQGMVAGFEAWIKEEEYVGKIVAAVGADWRTSQNKISQAFSGYNYVLTTEPRLVFGHTVGPNSYDTLMDTDLIQQWLGLK